AEFDALAGIDSDECVVNEVEALPQRHAEMVDELERRRTGTPLLAVDHDEIRVNASGKHCLADREEFPRMPDAELESRWLAAREASHLADEFHHADRRRET